MALSVITLGTAGGPKIWPGTPAPRCGIATAVVTDDKWYLIDAGHGTYTQIKRAGLDMEQLGGIFITHLHSDHIIDLNSVTLFGMFDFMGELPTIPIYGPGERRHLPPISPMATTAPQPIYPDNATPGITGTFNALMQAHATDLNDRILDALRPSPLDLWTPRDIEVTHPDFHPNTNGCPEITPWSIHEDDHVRVTATLVQHPPIAPAFGFRFDTADGSVTISGDTVPCDNLATLANETDLLLHEAIDFDWVDRIYPGRTDLEKASADHHRKSHSSPAGAGEIATKAAARRLALHHLVPANSPRAAFEQAATTYSGELLIPDDLAVIPLA